MPRLLQRSAKERLNLVWCYDETAGQRYRITLLKGFGLKGFLRFVARMWLACVGRVDGSFLALRLCGAHLLDDLFHGGIDAVFLELTFPDGDGRPAHLGKRVDGSAVALDVATELCLPKLNVALGLARVALGAAVPKATVDEDGDLAAGEGDVGFAGNLPFQAIARKARCAQALSCLLYTSPSPRDA